MKVKALKTFCGVITMYKGEERDCVDSPVLRDLLKCGYVEKVQEKTNKKQQYKKGDE